MRFVVYAINWNESRLLPAFLHHYREADRIVVCDTGSTDESEAIVRGAGREWRPFPSDGFNDLINQRIKNDVWKESRGQGVDFVIVQDLDEFVYFPDSRCIKAGLQSLKDQGATFAQSVGFNMICTEEEFVNAGKQREAFGADMPALLTRGFRDTNYDKVQVFQPDSIEETCFSAGAHRWEPIGRVVAGTAPLLLHYKHTGFEYTLERAVSIGGRLSATNLERQFSFHYVGTRDELADRLRAVYDTPTETVVSKPLRVRVVVGVHHTMEFLQDAVEDGHLHVFAFDADADIIAANHVRFSPPENYHLIPQAVSDSDGEITFNVCDNNTCSSVLDWSGRVSFGGMTPRRVQCTTLETFLTRLGVGSVEYLHIDAQGHDLAVLRGLGSRLSAVQAGVCESMGPNTDWTLYARQPSFEEVRSFLVENGYEVTWEANVCSGIPHDEVNITFRSRVV